MCHYLRSPELYCSPQAENSPFPSEYPKPENSHSLLSLEIGGGNGSKYSHKFYFSSTTELDLGCINTG